MQRTPFFIRYFSLLNRFHLDAMYLDDSLTIEFITKSCAERFGLPESSAMLSESSYSEKEHYSLRDIPDSGKLYDAALQTLHTAAPVSFTHTFPGSPLTTLYLFPDVLPDGTLPGIFVILSNADADCETGRRLLVEKEINRQLFEITNCAIWEYFPDTKTMVQYKKLDGRYSKNNLDIPDYYNTVTSWNLIHPDDTELFADMCTALDRKDAVIDYTFRSIGDNDEYIRMHFYGKALYDNDGGFISIVGRTTNADPHDDHHKIDPLTEVLNYNAIQENIQRCINRNANFRNEIHAFLLIDLDNFSDININFGQLYGDFLLENYAEMLQGFCDANDVIGRIGGDEFVIFMKNIESMDDPVTLANLILSRTRAGLRGQKSDCALTASIGISFYPEHGIDYDTLFSAADMALGASKRNGRDTYSVFSDSVPLIRNAEKQKPTYHNDWIKRLPMSFVENNIANFALDVFSCGHTFSDSVNRIFYEIGKFYDLSRISIMMYHAQGDCFRTTHLWCNDGFEITAENLTPPMKLNYKVYQQCFDERNLLAVSDVSEYNFDPLTAAYFNTVGTKALIQYAIIDEGFCYGVVNFSDNRKNRIWTSHETETVITVSRIVTSFLLRENTREELDNNRFYTEAIIRGQKLTNYAVDAQNYNLLYFSEYTGTQYPDIKLGAPCYRTLAGRDTPCTSCPIQILQQNRTPSVSYDTYEESTQLWHNISASRSNDPDGRDIYLISRSNVTSFLEGVNSKDRLTGISSYHRFQADAAALAPKAYAEKQKYALVYIDINKFTYINEQFGYSVGDEILQTLAETISEKLTADEYVCRVVADSFAVLAKFTSKEAFTRRIRRMNYLVSSIMKNKFPGITITFSVGVYIMDNNDPSLSYAMDRAKTAQQTVQPLHKPSLAYYSPELHLQQVREKEIEFMMHAALENNEFFIVLQPKVHAVTGRIAGAEALVRWKHGSTQMFPNDFIPLFEKNGFILELDYYVYELTFAAIRNWLNEGRVPPVISVNVSRWHLQDSSFVQRMVELLRKYKLPASHIELELTESLMYDNIEHLSVILDELRSLGFSISIDDFGSGFSSLNQLQELTADVVKLGKEFFLQNKMEGKRRTLILNTIRLIKGLDMRVVCEGVETKEQADFLAENQCDLIQGYYYHAPMAIEKFSQLDW